MFPLIYGKGVDRVYEIVELAVLAGLITQAGAWFSYRDEHDQVISRNNIEYKWQGKANLTEFVRENPQFLVELEDRLRGRKIEAPIGKTVDQEGYDVEEDGE